jgi:hypothetical protein
LHKYSAFTCPTRAKQKLDGVSIQHPNDNDDNCNDCDDDNANKKKQFNLERRNSLITTRCKIRCSFEVEKVKQSRYSPGMAQRVPGS